MTRKSTGTGLSYRIGDLWLSNAIALAFGMWLGCLTESHAQSWEYENYRGAYETPYDWEWDWYYDSYYEDARRDELEGLQHQSDWDLQDDVKGGLTQNPFLEQNNIVVLVEDGIVTLEGMVEDGAAIEDAIRQAYDAGAKDVNSKLRTQR